MSNVEEILQNKCMECTKEFFSLNQGKTFPYSRCKRCDVGRIVHEADSLQWKGFDSVKRD